MARRYDANPRFKLDIWQNEGTLWFNDPNALRSIIERENVPNEEVRARMGYGFLYLQDALEGKRSGRWAVIHIEYGILKHELVMNGPTEY